MPSTTLPPVDPARRRLLLAAVAATLAGYPGARAWAASGYESGTTPGFASGSGLAGLASRSTHGHRAPDPRPFARGVGTGA